MFPHKDGAGFNIMLQALPLDGRIVCREFNDDDRAQNEDGNVQSLRTQGSARQRSR